MGWDAAEDAADVGRDVVETNAPTTSTVDYGTEGTCCMTDDG